MLHLMLVTFVFCVLLFSIVVFKERAAVASLAAFLFWSQSKNFMQAAVAAFSPFLVPASTPCRWQWFSLRTIWKIIQMSVDFWDKRGTFPTGFATFVSQRESPHLRKIFKGL